MRVLSALLFILPCCLNYHQVFAGVSVEFSSLLSDADRLLVAQMQNGGDIAAEVSELSGREPKMAYTTYEESEKLRTRLLHRATRETSSQKVHPVHVPLGKSSSKNYTDTEIKSDSSSSKEAIKSRKGKNELGVVRIGKGNHYEVGEGRTAPLLLMGVFSMAQFFILSAVFLALITPVLGSLLLVIKFMFISGLIMIG